MRVVITGGTGFLGRTLAGVLTARGTLTGPGGATEPIDEVVLLDAFPLPDGVAVPAGPVEIVLGDTTDTAVVASAIDRADVGVFHLASMVSAGCEADFDGALHVNLDGFRNVLEACRAVGSRPRLVFTSSMAAFGGEGVADTVSDSTKLTPETTYGMTKAIGELFVNDYTRKGFIDGRSARLPTVIVRPGRPNAAASSWVSGLFREPLRGEECVVPVEPERAVPVSGYATVVDNLVRLYEADAAGLGIDRAVNLPAIDPDVEQMIAALERVADRPLGPITFKEDPAIVTIFNGWAQHSDSARADALGLVTDVDLDSVLRRYLADRF